LDQTPPIGDRAATRARSAMEVGDERAGAKGYPFERASRTDRAAGTSTRRGHRNQREDVHRSPSSPTIIPRFSEPQDERPDRTEDQERSAVVAATNPIATVASPSLMHFQGISES